MLEIERKYLLSAMPSLPQEAVALELEQGYLPGDHVPPGRLRRTQRPDGEIVFHHTIKQGAGLVRVEREEIIDEDTFANWWPATIGRRLSKRRWRVPFRHDPPLVLEIDEFTDRSLVLLEVELPGEDVRFAPPDWIRPFIVREVTDEPAYTNAALAAAGT